MIGRLVCRVKGHVPGSIFMEGGPPFWCERCHRMLPELGTIYDPPSSEGDGTR